MAKGNMKDNLKVLFATDFSPHSKISLRVLAQMRIKFKLDITFIHVITSFWKNWLASGLYQKEALQRLKTWQKELVGKVEPNKLFVDIGNCADTILSRVNKMHIDLIVLGSKDLKSKGRYKSGTTLENVVRHAKSSVLICKTEKISKILCGIDGSPSSEKALNCAMKWAKQYDARLTIIFVLPKMNVNVFGMDENEVLQEEEKIEKENVAKINTFLKKFNFDDLVVEKQIKWGMPSHVILDTAEDFEFDMIVIGARGHSVFHHVLIGSTAEKVLRFASCSLLVVR